MTEKPFRIVFLDAATFGDVSLKNYSALGECAFYETSTSEEVLARLRGAHAVVINKVVMDRSVLTASEAEELKLVAIAATGTDHVDLAVAKERGITVCNVPGYATEAVAQFTMALLLELVNNVGRYASLVRSGAWQKSRIFTLLDFPSFELAGKKLGIIGYGSIGQAVARIAQGFGMEILISVSPGVDGPVPAGRVPFNH
ncbi:MAG: glycerate dehydrogenase, partial [Deltaproteobacteria bacterium]|nr:glycerate dehydrogenase [Deltaproteobacteria bacterium]